MALVTDFGSVKVEDWCGCLALQLKATKTTKKDGAVHLCLFMVNCGVAFGSPSCYIGSRGWTYLACCYIEDCNLSRSKTS